MYVCMHLISVRVIHTRLQRRIAFVLFDGNRRNRIFNLRHSPNPLLAHL